MKSNTPVVVDVRAADVGYFSVKVSLGRHYEPTGVTVSTQIFPSLAPRLLAGMSPRSAMNNQPDGALVKVDGVHYFVGRDAVLFSSGREPRPVFDDYCLSNKYMALLRGALYYMSKEVGHPAEMVIKHLVVGLPLKNFARYQGELQTRLVGEHLLPDPTEPKEVSRVSVQRVSVIVQPQGALINHSLQSGRVLNDSSSSLVVDAGGGNLGWFMSCGHHPNWQRSGAYSKSMLACSYAVADGIDSNWRDNFEIIDRIDTAIRTGADSFKAGGKTYPLADHACAIEAVLTESVDQLIFKTEKLEDLDAILFTGGGAAVFYDYMKRKFPEHASVMHMEADPVFANVKGFQIAGEYLTAASM